MILLYSKIIGLPVVDLVSQGMISIIDDVVIDNLNMNITAFVLKKNGIMDKNIKVITNFDVIQILNDGLIVDDEGAINRIEEIVRVEKLFKDKYVGIGQKVITKSGETIGVVHDLLIDSKDLSIKKIIVKKLFSEKVISVNSIVEYIDKTICIKDKFEKIFVQEELPCTISAQ